MSPIVIDADAVSLILERLTGLCEILNTFTGDVVENRPIITAIYFIEHEVDKIESLVCSSPWFENAKKLSAEDLEAALTPRKGGDHGK